MPVDNFPNFADDFKATLLNLESKKILSLLTKLKYQFNDDTRHYLNGIFIHTTTSNKGSYLTGVATDTHRLSSSSIPIENVENFKPYTSKKTVFQPCNLL